jgi:hypothetical protein
MWSIVKVNPAEELRAKWTTCRLSGQPLVPPCCVDELGFIFNKEAVLQVKLHPLRNHLILAHCHVGPCMQEVVGVQCMQCPTSHLFSLHLCCLGGKVIQGMLPLVSNDKGWC